MCRYFRMAPKLKVSPGTPPPQVLVWLTSLLAGQGLPAPKAKARSSRSEGRAVAPPFPPPETSSTGDTIIGYGKKHLGSTYLEVATKDPGYVKWCMSQFSEKSSDEFTDFVVWSSQFFVLQNGLLTQIADLPTSERVPKLGQSKGRPSRVQTSVVTIASSLDFLLAQDPRDLEFEAQQELNEDPAYIEDGIPGSLAQTRI